MIAPCCIICGRWSEEAGGSFVQFKVIDSKEIEYNNDTEEKFGHPKGNWFFCDEHIGLAYRYKSLTWKEAEPLIKKDFENGEIPKPPVTPKFLDKVFKWFNKN
ncbi:MAG: hypothetical protein ABIP06_10305 [Pyrinomonadaceae bacterium]